MCVCERERDERERVTKTPAKMGLNKWDFSKSVFSRKDLENHSLHHAVERGDVDSLQRLIDTDIRQCITLVDSVNARDGLLKGTPLHVAAEEGNLKVAKVSATAFNRDLTANSLTILGPVLFFPQFLLINEADVMAKDKHGKYTHTTQRRRGESMKEKIGQATCFLEKLTLNLHYYSDAGCEPLHLAAHRGHSDLILLFIVKGALVNNRNFLGDTALHYAANKVW